MIRKPVRYDTAAPSQPKQQVESIRQAAVKAHSRMPPSNASQCTSVPRKPIQLPNSTSIKDIASSLQSDLDSKALAVDPTSSSNDVNAKRSHLQNSTSMNDIARYASSMKASLDTLPKRESQDLPRMGRERRPTLIDSIESNNLQDTRLKNEFEKLKARNAMLEEKLRTLGVDSPLQEPTNDQTDVINSKDKKNGHGVHIVKRVVNENGEKTCEDDEGYNLIWSQVKDTTQEIMKKLQLNVEIPKKELISMSGEGEKLSGVKVKSLLEKSDKTDKDLDKSFQVRDTADDNCKKGEKELNIAMDELKDEMKSNSAPTNMIIPSSDESRCAIPTVISDAPQQKASNESELAAIASPQLISSTISPYYNPANIDDRLFRKVLPKETKLDSIETKGIAKETADILRESTVTLRTVDIDLKDDLMNIMGSFGF